MLNPNDLTKAELLQVMEMLECTAEHYLNRALSQIERQRNDAHYERSRRLIDEERKHNNACSEILRPYEGKHLIDIPPDVVERARAEWEKARAAGRKWDKLNGID